MTTPVVRIVEPVSYAAASRLQDELVTKRISGRIPDIVLLLEHRPVVTLGRGRRDEHLLVSPEVLSQLDIDFVVASRGGDVTYHGPGQLILYPILKLTSKVSGAHGYLSNLEEIAIATAMSFGVPAFSRKGKSGAWTEQGKIAAIGFRLKRWISQHGMSFNVDPDLSRFKLIVPCGLVGEPVSSLREILQDACPLMDAVAFSMVAEMERVFDKSMVIYKIDRLEDFISIQNFLITDDGTTDSHRRNL